MLYIIHSPKQTEYNGGTKMYWKPREHGYTSIMAEAGFYTEEDKARISTRSNEWSATFLPVTRELLEEMQDQLVSKRDILMEQEQDEIAHHIERMDYLHKRRNEIDSLMDKLAEIELDTQGQEEREK